MRAKNVMCNQGDKGMSRSAARLRALRLIAIGLCFVTVFALTLAFGSGLLGAPDVSGNVAEAVFSGNNVVAVEGSILGGGEATAWTAEPFFGDHGNFELSTIALSQSAVVGTSKVWTYAETFENHSVTKTNQNVYRAAGSAELSGDITPDDPSSVPDYVTPTWTVKAAYHSSSYIIAFAFFYQIPDIFANIFDMFDVNVNVTFNQLNFSNIDNRYICVRPYDSISSEDMSNAAKTAVNSADEYKNKEQDKVVSVTDNAGKNVGRSFKLSKSNRYILIGLEGKASSNNTSFAAAQGLTITYTLTLKTSRSSTFSFDDEAAPVWGEDWNYTATSQSDGTSPYVTDKTLLSGYLSEIDEANYNIDSDGKFLSYTNKKLGEINGKSYYKHTQLTAIDAYNYSGNIPFKFDPADSTDMSHHWEDARKTMGLSKKTMQASPPMSVIFLNWDGASYDYTAGIKTIHVSVETDTGGGNSFDINTLTDLKNGVTGFGLGSEGQVGYLEVTPRNNGEYGCFTLDIYMYDNATLEISTTDFGGQDSTDKTLEYGGIDPSAPKRPRLLDNDDEKMPYVTDSERESSKATAKWFHEEKLNFYVGTDNPKGVVAPNIYYIQAYNVTEVNKMSYVPDPEKDGFWAKMKEEGSGWEVTAILKPTQAEESGVLVTYDFINGTFSSGGKVTNAYSETSFKKYCTGTGQYLFRFYALDLAGNSATEAFDFYVNVDYVQPAYQAYIRYGDDLENTIESKATDTSKANGAWVTNKNVCIDIYPGHFDKENKFVPGFNVSGNTIVFDDGNGAIQYFSTQPGNTSAFDGNGNSNPYTMTYSGLANQMPSGTKFRFSIQAKSDESGTYFHIEVQADADDGVGDVPDIDFTSQFTLLAGFYSGDQTSSVTEDAESGYVDRAWGEGIQLRVDTNDPVFELTPSDVERMKDLEYDDSDVKLASDFLDTPAAERAWYNSNYIGATVVVNNADGNLNEYAEGYSVYFVVKVFDKLDVLRAYLENTPIGNNYWNLKNGTVGEDFDKILIKKGTEFDDDTLEVFADAAGISLLANDSAVTAGIRLIFVWAEDQAGNVSELNAHYVFVDSNQYKISAEVGSSSLLAEKTASISLGNKTSAMRGEEITLTMSVNDGYAPYTLSMGSNDLLHNYSSDMTFSLADEHYADLLNGFENTDASGNFVVTFKFDALDVGEVPMAAREFIFKHRQIVSYTVNKTNSVTYKAGAVKASDLTLVTENISEALKGSVLEAFKLKFIDDEGNPLYKLSENDRLSTSDPDEAKKEGETPVPFDAINVGTYSAYVYIPYDDEAFVAENLSFEEGEQIFGDSDLISLTIAPKQLYVIPDEDAKTYGEKIKLTSKLYEDAEGEAVFTLDPSEGTLSGFLKLDFKEWGNSSDYTGKIPAGRYQIIAGEKFAIGDNYAVNFVTGKQYTVKQREVTITILGASKSFGDPDPRFSFAIDEAQFADEDIDEILTEMFGSTGASQDGKRVFESYAISRAEGENVASYEFDKDVSKIPVNINYLLKTADEGNGRLEIKQRTVKIAVTGSTSLKFGDTFDRASAKLGYRIADIKDEIDLVKQEIAKLIAEGTLVLGEEATQESEFDSTKYSSVQYYVVTLGAEYDQTNVILQLDSENGGDRYYVYTAAQGVITISLKEGQTLEMVFGTQWQPTTTFTHWDNRAKFDLFKDGERFTLGSNDRISWTINIAGHGAGEYLSVGTYAATISDVTLSIAGEPDLSKFIANDITVTVTPAPIVIEPTFEKERMYGEDDSAYNFGFEIVTINKQPVPADGYAGMTLDALKALIPYGKAFSYARAVFKSGARERDALPTDPVTVDGVTADGLYYLPELIGTLRAEGEGAMNFTVSSEISDSDRLEITPREITLDLALFVGLSKDFDGSATAYYMHNKLLADAASGTTIAYDLAVEAYFSDIINLQFRAEYRKDGSAQAGSPTEIGGTIVSIFFSEIEIICTDATGKASQNYRIARIVNSKPQNGAKAFGNAVEEDVEVTLEQANSLTIEIFHTDNNLDNYDDDNNNIVIYPGAIGVRRDELVVTKIYDGRTDFSADNVALNAGGAGVAKASAYLLSTAKMSLLTSEQLGVETIVNAFTDKNASELKYINLALLFKFDGIAAETLNSITIANNKEEFDEYADESVQLRFDETLGGFVLTIDNFAASISKRLIDGNSFKSIETKDRSYNSATDIEVTYELADGAVFDAVSELGLYLAGEADGKDVGEHVVTLKQKDEKSLNSNYSFDLASAQEKFKLSATISKAKLVPHIMFEERVYNASEDVTDFSFGGTDFTALAYNEELAKELAKITFEHESISIVLSRDGKPYPGVILNKGAEAAHSVLVSGIVLKAEEGVNLSNYELAGVCYDSEGKALEAQPKFVSGATIDGLEIEDALILHRATLQIMDTNVTVETKIYDGTTDATIHVSLPIDMPDADKELITLSAAGRFRSSNVGRIGVLIPQNSAQIRLTELGEKTNPDVLDNYVIGYTDSSFYGDIVERPVSVSVDLGEKTYDAKASIKTEKITYAFDDNMLHADSVNYSVKTVGGAYFDDKNVKLDANKKTEVRKEGTIYNPQISDRTSESRTNYMLAIASEKAPGDPETAGLTLYAVRYKSGKMVLAADYVPATPSGSEAGVAEDGPTAAPAEDEDVPEMFYYELPSTQYFIKATDKTSHDLASVSGDLIGYIELNGTGYYAVKAKFAEDYPDKVEQKALITYIRAEGIINRLTVLFSTTAVSPKGNTTAFSKQYDGTARFTGVEGTDFVFSSNAIVGKRTGDDLVITNVSGVYNSANTTATHVIFTGELGGADKDNYVLDTSKSATVPAKIVKRSITAHLNDAEVVYGTVAGDIKGDITYSFTNGDDTVPLINDGSYFYADYDEYLKFLGFATNDLGDKKYIDEITEGNLYKEANGQYELTDQYEAGNTFIRLGGTFFNLPVAVAKFSIQVPNVGSAALSYTLNGGEATNFTFKFDYTDNERKTSNVTITVKDVYVAAESNDVTVVYGGSIPKAGVKYIDSDGNPYSFAAGTSAALFVWQGRDFSPVMKWKAYNLETNEEIPGDVQYPSFSRSGVAYVARFEAPDGVDADGDGIWEGANLNPLIKNYRFHFGTVVDDSEAYYISYETVNNDPKPGDLSPTGSFYRARTAVMTIEEPKITGITVTDNAEFDFIRGQDQTASIVSGTLAGDEVIMVGDDKTTPISVSSAGKYTGYIKVTRTFKWDSNDAGERVSYCTEEKYTVTINPRTMSLSATDVSRMFDGTTYKYLFYKSDTTTDDDCLLSGLDAAVSLDSRSADLTISKLIGSVYYVAYGINDDGSVVPLLKDGDGNYYHLNDRGARMDWSGEAKPYEIMEVGTYRVEIALNDHFVSSNGGNYAKSTVNAYVTITARPVEIKDLKLDGQSSTEFDAQGAYVFRGMYDEEKSYAVTYNVSLGGPELDATSPAYINKANTVILGLENVNSAGKYSFMIVLKTSIFDASNYAFTGAKGVLELTAKKFATPSGGESASSDTVEFVGESESGVIANRMVVRHIKSTGGIGSDIDMWNRVNSYMPHISQNAKLVGIVQVQLYYGTNIVSTADKDMELSIRIPEGVDKDLNDVAVYIKDRSGGLVKLNEYNCNNGVLSFATDYLGEIVFVDMSVNTLPSWLYYVAGAAIVLAAAFIAWLIVAYAIRKSKLKRLI